MTEEGRDTERGVLNPNLSPTSWSLSMLNAFEPTSLMSGEALED